MLTPDEKKRYSRQLVLKDFSECYQNRLLSSTVALVGVGGLGVPAAQYLAGAGIGTLILIDDDEISISNLHRQVIYKTEQAGELKADVAAKYLEELNDNIDITVVTDRITRDNALEILREADLVLDGSDNFSTRYLVNDACVMLDIPLIQGAVNKMEGHLMLLNFPLDNGKRSCHYRDVYPEAPEPGTVQNCEEAGVIGSVAGTIGTMMATEAIKYLSGYGKISPNKMLFIDAENDLMRSIGIPELRGREISELPEEAAFCLTEDRLVDWADLKTMDHQLVDVRTHQEHEAISGGGILIPLNELRDRLDELAKDKPVVFYCHTGMRSDRAVQMVSEKTGRRDIYSVRGGIFSLENPT